MLSFQLASLASFFNSSFLGSKPKARSATCDKCTKTVPVSSFFAICVGCSGLELLGFNGPCAIRVEEVESLLDFGLADTINAASTSKHL